MHANTDNYDPLPTSMNVVVSPWSRPATVQPWGPSWGTGRAATQARRLQDTFGRLGATQLAPVVDLCRDVSDHVCDVVREECQEL